MTENPSGAGYGDAAERRKLTELRTTLLTLHKTLLDMERREYERETRARVHRGIVSTGDGPPTIWLAAQYFGVCGAAGRNAGGRSAGHGRRQRSAIGMARRIFVPSESGDAFQKRYFDAIQKDPAVVMEHAELARLFNSEPADPEQQHEFCRADGGRS